MSPTLTPVDGGSAGGLSFAPLSALVGVLAALLRAGLTPRPMDTLSAWALALTAGVIAAAAIWLAAILLARLEATRGRNTWAHALTVLTAVSWVVYGSVYIGVGSLATHWLHPLAAAALVATWLIVFYAWNRQSKTGAQVSAVALFSTLLLAQAVFLVHLWFAEGPWQPMDRAPRPTVFWLVPVAAVVAGVGRVAASTLPRRVRILDSPLDALLLGTQFLAAAAGFGAGLVGAAQIGVIRLIVTFGVLARIRAATLRPSDARVPRAIERVLVWEALATGTYFVVTTATGA